MIKNLTQSAESAAELFATFREGKPDLVPLGIDEVDDQIGGMFKGTLVIVAMDTGVGKSRFILSSALRFAELCETPGRRVGIISTEDGEDVVGARLLAHASGVDSRKIRRKDFEGDDLEKLSEGMDKLHALDASGNGPLFAYNVGGTLDQVLASAEELTDAGAAVVWLDYLQKIRGVSDDRRGEVGKVLTDFQRTCAAGGAVAGVVSQFARRSKGRPKLHHLKESGDIENEARLALLGFKSDIDDDIIEVDIAKSTFGGNGTTFYRRTTASGMLEPWSLKGVWSG